MNTIELTSTHQCPVCSGSVVLLPEIHTDDSLAKCAGCDAELGRWGDIREVESSPVSPRAEQDLKDALKGMPDFKK